MTPCTSAKIPVYVCRNRLDVRVDVRTGYGNTYLLHVSEYVTS